MITRETTIANRVCEEYFMHLMPHLDIEDVYFNTGYKMYDSHIALEAIKVHPYSVY